MSAVPLLLAASLLAQEAPGTGTFTTAAVAADHPAAAEAGAEMLRAGGNAVDAAAATSLALSVVRPYSCGLGGGGFLVYYDAAAGRAHALDYREHAPAAATRDMFLSDPASSRTGGKAVAVPGTVAGLCFAQQRWGTLSRAEVFAPAVRLARSGVPLDEHDRGIRTRFVEQFAADPALRRRFPAFWTGYLFDGNLPPIDANPGPSPQADLLAAIAEEGPDAFYRGPAAAARLVEAVRDAGGVMTAADLAGYEPRLVEPLTGDVGGLTLHVMPPPSSGGVATLEILNILAARERTHGPLAFGSPRYEHVLTEALKHAFADRAEFLGDPRAAAAAGAPLPVARLTSPAYAEALAATIDPDRTFPPPHYGGALPAIDGGTSHLSVIDAAGNAVACTETINTVFGSLVVVPGTGVILNNEMDDFAAVPGAPNAFGLIQSEANAVGAGRTPLSSMSPTIAVRDGRAAFAVGASGGPRIITATVQVLLNLTRGGLPVADAVAAPRLHHQWLPDRVEVEANYPPAARAALTAKGHVVTEGNGVGVVQAVTRPADGPLAAAADARKGGGVAGF